MIGKVSREDQSGAMGRSTTLLLCLHRTYETRIISQLLPCSLNLSRIQEFQYLRILKTQTPLNDNGLCSLDTVSFPIPQTRATLIAEESHQDKIEENVRNKSFPSDLPVLSSWFRRSERQDNIQQ